MVADSYQLRLIEKQLNTYQINLRKSEIVEKEIAGLSDNTKVYDKIGRLFVVADKNEICANLKKSQTLISADLENQKQLYKKYQDLVNEHTKHYNEVSSSSKQIK